MHGREIIPEYTELSGMKSTHSVCSQRHGRPPELFRFPPEAPILGTFSLLPSLAAHRLPPLPPLCLRSGPLEIHRNGAPSWSCATRSFYTLPHDSSHFPEAFHVSTLTTLSPQVTDFSWGGCTGTGAFSFRGFSYWLTPDTFFSYSSTGICPWRV